MPRQRHLTIEEKRDWLADIFRDTGGEFSQADKFKALVEDTRLAQLQEEKEQAATAASNANAQDSLPLLADMLPPPENEIGRPDFA